MVKLNGKSKRIFTEVFLVDANTPRPFPKFKAVFPLNRSLM